MPVCVLGISAFYHDSAACLIKDGQIIGAAQEERFSRVKHDSSFPKHAIQYCLRAGGLAPESIDYIVFYEKPFLKFDRLFETYLAFAPRGFKSFQRSFVSWVKDKLFQKESLVQELRDLLGDGVDWKSKLLFSEHHLSHAASAFFPSPFQRAAVLTLDGVGEWATGSLAIGNGNKLEIIKEMRFPHSLGLLYSAFTYYLGFKVNSGEYKVMGLAPYGNPVYVDTIYDNLVTVAEDGSFRLEMEYFGFATDLVMTSGKFDKLFGGPRREPESTLGQREMDLAASIQRVVEDIVLRLGKWVSEVTGERNLCLAGGVALNCVANGKLLTDGGFERIWVQPAAGDAGGALGAALAIWHLHLKNPMPPKKSKDLMQGGFLGPSFSNSDVEEFLSEIGAVFRKLDSSDLVCEVAGRLAEGSAVGWMQGRMEFGPRALGSRSILADPRKSTMQRDLNLKVKFRESFRPFAPSVLDSDVDYWFDLHENSPYMLFVAPVVRGRRKDGVAESNDAAGLDAINRVRSEIPAVTHVDYSARIQTVHKETNARFHSLIMKFKDITGCGVLVNTSFNIRGEPIVCSPADAFRCFMGSELDVLVMENFVLKKSDQPLSLKKEYKSDFDLD